MLERVAHTMTPVLWKNKIIPLLNDSKTESGLANSYSQVIFYTFESVKHLHAMQFVKSFLNALLLLLSKLDISHNYITTSNWFWGARPLGSLWSGLQCWTAGWAAKTTAVESLTQFWADVQSMEVNLTDRCQQATKTFCFFQLGLHVVVKLFFNTATILKTKAPN